MLSNEVPPTSTYLFRFKLFRDLKRTSQSPVQLASRFGNEQNSTNTARELTPKQAARVLLLSAESTDRVTTPIQLQPQIAVSENDQRGSHSISIETQADFRGGEMNDTSKWFFEQRKQPNVAKVCTNRQTELGNYMMRERLNNLSSLSYSRSLQDLEFPARRIKSLTVKTVEQRTASNLRERKVVYLEQIPLKNQIRNQQLPVRSEILSIDAVQEEQEDLENGQEKSQTAREQAKSPSTTMSTTFYRLRPAAAIAATTRTKSLQYQLENGKHNEVLGIYSALPESNEQFFYSGILGKFPSKRAREKTERSRNVSPLQRTRERESVERQPEQVQELLPHSSRLPLRISVSFKNAIKERLERKLQTAEIAEREKQLCLSATRTTTTTTKTTTATTTKTLARTNSTQDRMANTSLSSNTLSQQRIVSFPKILHKRMSTEGTGINEQSTNTVQQQQQTNFEDTHDFIQQKVKTLPITLCSPPLKLMQNSNEEITFDQMKFSKQNCRRKHTQTKIFFK